MKLRKFIEATVREYLNEAHIDKYGNLKDLEYSLTPAQENHLLRLNNMKIEDVIDNLNDLKFNPDTLPKQYTLSIHDEKLMYDAERRKWVDGSLY
jgi:hypothetical protein